MDFRAIRIREYSRKGRPVARGDVLRLKSGNGAKRVSLDKVKQALV